MPSPRLPPDVLTSILQHLSPPPFGAFLLHSYIDERSAHKSSSCISRVEDQNTILACCLVSKGMNLICTRLLYRSICLQTRAAFLAFVEAIRADRGGNPPLGQLVLQLCLPSDESHVWNKDLLDGSDPNQPVTLAVVLPLLPNLRHLNGSSSLKSANLALSLALVHPPIHLTSLSGLKFTVNNYLTLLIAFPSFSQTLRILRCSFAAEISTQTPVASFSSTSLPSLEHLCITIIGKGTGAEFFFDLVARKWDLPELKTLGLVLPDETNANPAALLGRHGRKLENFVWDQGGANFLPTYLLHLHRMPKLSSLATRPFSLGATRGTRNETALAGVRDLVLLNKAAEDVVIDEFLYEVLSMRLFPSLERVLWDSGNGKNVAWKKMLIWGEKVKKAGLWFGWV
ncbi:hypothetical protein BDY24DRAFT_438581 [Mrakia frigida]|uniref:uncharacterized protein n=1 Tax=Mrakia frigida TaxID=29902 RepID=UPI003FCC0A13